MSEYNYGINQLQEFTAFVNYLQIAIIPQSYHIQCYIVAIVNMYQDIALTKVSIAYFAKIQIVHFLEIRRKHSCVTLEQRLFEKVFSQGSKVCKSNWLIS